MPNPGNIVACLNLIVLPAIIFVIILVRKKRKNKQGILRENALRIMDDITLYFSKKKLGEKFITDAEATSIFSELNKSYNELEKIKNSLNKKDCLHSKIAHFLGVYKSQRKFIAEHNSRFIKCEKLKCKKLLSNIDKKCLDEQQQTVVVSDEDRTLVLAGAGSGKTLTIAGKVSYLCNEKHVNPQDILLIAFTHKSAEEMTERISIKLDIPVKATTFHKLGLDIIKASSNKSFDISETLDAYVHNYFQNNIKNSSHLIKNLVEYFAYYINVPSDISDFSSLGEVYEHEKTADFETIKAKCEKSQYVQQQYDELATDKKSFVGETMKSLEEVAIANFLFINGIEYEYERTYPYKSENSNYKIYKPDFYLPEYDIYIEHFGVDKYNRLPWLSSVEEQKYIEGMKWKREFHKKNSTKLLETYSYYSTEGVLLENLEKILKENGVVFREIDFYSVFNTTYIKESDKYFAEFMHLCSTFIVLFKSNGYDINELYQLQHKNKKHKGSFYEKRTKLFLDIIFPIINGYNEMLKKTNAIDFSDMINKATEIVTKGFPLHPYKYIIIDEFQDISVARYKLIKAILNQTKAKLLCVGDDWQSIYRFAGSDIFLFTNFERYFGPSSILRLEKTYRNSQQLIDEAGRFIMMNPLQYKKTLKSNKSLNYPIIFWNYDENPFSVLRKIINKIINEFGEKKSILLLGRTVYDFEIIKESNLFTFDKNKEKVVFTEHPNTPITFLTVHKAKGLEADNVVLLNFQNSKLGFPNKIINDPILDLVLSSTDTYMYAEERRLLYVALTRTKNRVFILTSERSPSEFARDFSDSKSVYTIRTLSNTDDNSIPCPRCKTGNLIVRKNERDNKYFVGCTNYPKCDYTVNNTTIMTNTRICPSCGGFLVQKTGKYGKFYCCTNYPLCTYTEKIIP